MLGAGLLLIRAGALAAPDLDYAYRCP